MTFDLCRQHRRQFCDGRMGNRAANATPTTTVRLEVMDVATPESTGGAADTRAAELRSVWHGRDRRRLDRAEKRRRIRSHAQVAAVGQGVRIRDLQHSGLNHCAAHVGIRAGQGHNTGADYDQPAGAAVVQTASGDRVAVAGVNGQIGRVAAGRGDRDVRHVRERAGATASVVVPDW